MENFRKNFINSVDNIPKKVYYIIRRREKKKISTKGTGKEKENGNCKRITRDDKGLLRNHSSNHSNRQKAN